MIKHELKIVALKGKDIVPYIKDLARLRIEIFKEYPYLYVGDFAYETKYLKTYTDCAESTVIFVFDHDKVVGASTCMPLEFEVDEFKKPFLDHNIKVRDVFFLGESVLLPEYRGRKIYRHFFQGRESAARNHGCKIATFYAVERASDDPRRPKDYQSLDEVWQYFGYQKHPELSAYFKWKEIGEEEESEKKVTFWLKNL